MKEKEVVFFVVGLKSFLFDGYRFYSCGKQKMSKQKEFLDIGCILPSIATNNVVPLFFLAGLWAYFLAYALPVNFHYLSKF